MPQRKYALGSVSAVSSVPRVGGIALLLGRDGRSALSSASMLRAGSCPGLRSIPQKAPRARHTGDAALWRLPPVLTRRLVRRRLMRGLFPRDGLNEVEVVL